MKIYGMLKKYLQIRQKVNKFNWKCDLFYLRQIAYFGQIFFLNHCHM